MRIAGLLLLGLIASLALASPRASAQNTALLLFDGETGRVFAGCLNCSRYDTAAVCNRYGEFGSRYQKRSIWNRYGTFGSRYQTSSPWNRYGQGLRVVDPDGNYYGVFGIGSLGTSRLEIVAALREAYDFFDGDLAAIRDWFCDG